VSLVLGGSGITPGYSLIARFVLTVGDEMEIRVVDANKSEQDILLREGLEDFVRIGNGRLEIEPVLSHPSEK
jgi:nitrate reductase (NAD(P)H)